MINIQELFRVVNSTEVGQELCNDSISIINSWIDRNRNLVYEDSANKLINILEDIVCKKLITEEDKNDINNLIKYSLAISSEYSLMAYLRHKVLLRENIGIDVIDKLLGNEDLVNRIHVNADKQIYKAMMSYSNCKIEDPELVFISLVILSIKYYDGNFYEQLQNYYIKSYEAYSEQKVNGTIRSLINQYNDMQLSGTKPRIINTVLHNAIVPEYFLNKFFDFIYDVYKRNFECELSDDLYESFKFVYDGLRGSITCDDKDIEITATRKSYKLIQSTKELILDNTKTDALINLSIIVVKLIDKYYWDKDINIYNSYLKTGFEKWFDSTEYKNEISSTRQHSEFHSRLKPSLILLDNEIYIESTKHKIQYAGSYNDVEIVIKNGDEVIYQDSSPNIREIIGGYEIVTKRIKINAPLGKLRYEILPNIYDSKEHLNREYIVFNEKGKELNNNNDYSGTAIFCTSKEIEGHTPYKVYDNYLLSNKTVEVGDVVIIEDRVFSFSHNIKPGIFGDEYPNCYLYSEEKSVTINVLKNIQRLIFDSLYDSNKYEIIINNQRHKLSDYIVHKTLINNKYRYNIELGINKTGIYTIEVRNLLNGQERLEALFEVAVDEFLKYDHIQDGDHYLLEVKTGFIADEIIEEINPSIDDFENICSFDFNGCTYTYKLPFNLCVFRLDGKEWRSRESCISINDINTNTVLDIYNANIDGLQIWASSGQLLNDNIFVKDNGVYKSVNIGFLLSYRDYESVWFCFTKQGKFIQRIDCYNRCVLDYKGLILSCRSNQNGEQLVDVKTTYFGEGNVAFRITNTNEKEILPMTDTQNGQIKSISGLKSFVPYKIIFYEVEKGLFGKLKEPRVMGSIDKVFYRPEDFVRNAFAIKKIIYEDRNGRKVPIKKSSNYILFDKQICGDKFVGRIFDKNFGKRYWLNKISPLNIEMCSDVIDDTMELYIDYDGDGLLYDIHHGNIMNRIEDKYAPSIYTYIIDLTKREKNE